MQGSPQFSKPPTPFNIAGPNKRQSGGAGSEIIASGQTLGAVAVLPFAVGSNVPAAAEFTLVNAHSATIADNSNGPLVWQCNSGGLGSNTLTMAVTPVPAGNWTYTIHARGWGGAGNGVDVGLSDGTKFDLVNWGGTAIGLQTWNTTTSNASAAGTYTGPMPDGLWLRASWNAGTTTRTFSVSPDGFTWYVISQTNTPFLTPTEFCFGGNISANNSTYPMTISIDYLVQT